MIPVVRFFLNHTSVPPKGNPRVGRRHIRLYKKEFWTSNLAEFPALFMLCVILFFSGIIPLQSQIPTDGIEVANDCDFPLTAQLVNPSCQNGLDGSITLIGGTNTSLSFNWLNLPIDGPIAGGLDAGTYVVQVSDPNCTDTLSFTLVYENPIVAGALNQTICGPEMVNFLQGVEGGSNTYNLEISTVFGTPINCTNCSTTNVPVSVNSAYNVRIRDSEGDCYVDRTVTVDVLPDLVPEVTQTDDSCNGNGSILVQASGGSGNYQYALDGNAYQNSNIFGGLEEGNYSVIVQDTAGCREQIDVTIEQTYTIPELDFDINQPICYQSADGSVEGFSTTPVSDFQFSLIANEDGVYLSEDPVFDGLGPGSYVLYAINDANCQIPVLEFGLASPDPIIFSLTTEDPPCPGGTGEVELSAEGGNGDFQFSINGLEFGNDTLFNLPAGLYTAFTMDGGGCVDSSLFLLEGPEGPPVTFHITPSCPGVETGIVIVEAGKLVDPIYYSLDTMDFSIDNEFYNLPPGPDTLYIQDSEGCIFTYPITIPLALPPNLSLDVTPVTCPGGEDGALSVSQVNGSPLENLQFSVNGTDYYDEPTFVELSADIYTLYVQDTVPCVHQYYFLVNDPPDWELEPEVEPVVCFGESNGSVNLSVTGATPPYRYALNGVEFQDTAYFAQLAAGDYTALLLDSNNCTFAQSFEIEQPDELIPELTIINETCNNQNGAIVCAPYGGVMPYTITWNTGDTTHFINHLDSGNYKVSVTDAHGCTTNEPATVDNQDGPSLLGDIENVDCHGWTNGEIDLSVFGGTEPYYYSWSNGTHTQDQMDLPAGSYVVTVTDVYLCSSTKSFEIFEPTPIELSSQSGQGAEGWYINLIVEGGQSPYFYLWSNGESTEDLFNLSGGTYFVTVTDSRDCQEVLEVFLDATATEEPVWAGGIKLFPNPVQDELYLELPEEVPGGMSVSIYNAQGQRIVGEQALSGGRNLLEVGHLPKGIYLLKIRQKNGLDWIFRQFVKG